MSLQRAAGFSIVVALGCALSWQTTCSGGDEGSTSVALASSQTSAASSSSSGGGHSAMNPCTACGQPEDSGALMNAAIDEASG
ncbi:MAG TPA: hypothetical protein VFB62_17935, partial [Polyangiaceae bacterium]|nr:hypothetical protein [Polyangiaceae bacterium]